MYQNAVLVQDQRQAGKQARACTLPARKEKNNDA
jgi:hypothetical protein